MKVAASNSDAIRAYTSYFDVSSEPFVCLLQCLVRENKSAYLSTEIAAYMTNINIISIKYCLQIVRKR